MFELTLLGFAPSEIHRVTPDDNCCLYVPVNWYGEDSFLAISTSTRLDLALDGPGLRSGRLPLVRDRGDFTVHMADAVNILGLERPASEVTTFPGRDEGNVVGRVGAPFFSNAVLAFDPAGPYAAISRRDWSPPRELSVSFEALPLVGASGLPITMAVAIAGAPKLQFATLLDTYGAGSYISRAAISALPPKLVRSGHDTKLRPPSGTVVGVELEVSDDMPSYAVDVGAEITLVLGIDVLRRFLTIFDFRAGVAWLRPYGAAEH